MSNGDTGWSKAPIIVLIGLISSIIAIFAFMTGKQSLPEIIGTGPPTPVSTSKPASDNRLSTTTLIPTPSVPTAISTPNEPILEGSPSEWLPDPEDIPDGFTYHSSKTLSNEDIAKQYDNPTEMFNRLEGWGRVTGYSVTYVTSDLQNACSLKTGFANIILYITLHKSASGADEHFEWRKSRDRNNPDIYRQEEYDSVGDKAYVNRHNVIDECSSPNGDNSSWIAYQIMFRRYNVLSSVWVSGAQGIANESDLEALGIRLAHLLDLRLVAESK